MQHLLYQCRILLQALILFGCIALAVGIFAGIAALSGIAVPVILVALMCYAVAKDYQDSKDNDSKDKLFDP